MDPALREPYEIYFRWIRMLSAPTCRHLDLCCGDGRLSAGFHASDFLCLMDLSKDSVHLALRRNGNFSTGVVGDVETLPFADESFDLVTCAGSISYFEPHTGAREIARILRPGGHLVCVDSLNHNWIYRFNRWIRHLRGERSLSTLNRMPNARSIALLAGELGSVRHLSHHGIFIFAIPLLKSFFRTEKIPGVLKKLDEMFAKLSRLAFKFVLVVQKDDWAVSRPRPNKC
jgi:ubiquinone/menaquinone biosynthesis C-methylase UbiE